MCRQEDFVRIESISKGNMECSGVLLWSLISVAVCFLDFKHGISFIVHMHD